MRALASWPFLISGGETIKQINQQSGAFCELDRRPPPNPNEKIFIIRGSHEQVELAKRMISEKLGLVSSAPVFVSRFSILCVCGTRVMLILKTIGFKIMLRVQNKLAESTD